MTLYWVLALIPVVFALVGWMMLNSPRERR